MRQRGIGRSCSSAGKGLYWGNLTEASMIAAALSLLLSLPFSSSFAAEDEAPLLNEKTEATATSAQLETAAPKAAAATPAKAEAPAKAAEAAPAKVEAADATAPRAVEAKVVVKEAVVEKAALKAAAPAAAEVPPAAAAAPAAAKTDVKAAVPAAEAPAAPVAAAPAAKAEAPVAKAAEAFKPVGVAAPYATVLDSYTAARAGFEEWLKEASAQAKELDERETALKKDIQAKEAELTQVKFQGGKDSKQKIKDLEKETKELWRQLGALGKETQSLARKLQRDAATKVRELNGAVASRLGELGRD